MPTDCLPELSVIVPVRDEATLLPRLIAQLQAQRGLRLEVIVVDGGSRDATVAVARAAGLAVVTSAAGRGRQMNAGARAAAAPTLLFLHADCQLPSPTLLADALGALARATRDAPAVAGHFPVRFERAQPGYERLFRFLEGKSRLNRPGTIHGDQGLLIGRGYFKALGGFDEGLPVMEDERLAAKVFATGRWILLPGVLETSARRFEVEGHAARYTLMALMMGLHAAGLDDFFREAPAVYAAQAEASRLDLRPFVALVRRLLRRHGLRASAVTIWRVGRYLRSNAWQLAYWRDAARGGDPRLLERFDRRLAPLLNHAGADALAALLVCAWFFAWLPWTTRR